LSGEPTVLSIDLGTSGAKCALVQLDGRIVAWDSCPLETQVIGNDGAEQQPADWWQAICQATRGVCKEAASSNIVAICASTQGEGTVAVDQNGEVLHPALLWLDMRGHDALAKQVGSGPIRVAGFNARKLARWIRLTGGAPALSGKDPAGHMLYVKHDMPEVYRKTHKFLNVIDYLNFRFTDRMVAPPDSIMTSWVTDNRDPGDIRYHPGLIQSLGIDADKLPEIVRATDVIGHLTTSAAADLGLEPGIPVVAGTIDTSAAAIGSGAVGDGEVHLYVGTSSWFGAHVPWKKTNLQSQFASVPCAMADKYLMIALQSSAGSNLSFLRDQVFFNKDELLQNEEQPDVYRILDLIADRVPAGSRGIMYTPWLFGERCPVDDGTLRASFLNLSMQHSREEMIRAVLEGVALNTRWMLEPVKKFLRQYPVNEITIVGGGGASDVWCQIFADVMNVRVRQLESPIQANVLGSAFIAGVGIGAMEFDAVADRTQIRKVYEPIADHRSVYDQAFANFTDAYKRLSPWYRRINRTERV
jgi:xylulokinase